ncbi:dynein heavy chain, partial [Kipferlia bialata]
AKAAEEIDRASDQMLTLVLDTCRLVESRAKADVGSGDSILGDKTEGEEGEEGSKTDLPLFVQRKLEMSRSIVAAKRMQQKQKHAVSVAYEEKRRLDAFIRLVDMMLTHSIAYMVQDAANALVRRTQVVDETDKQKRGGARQRLVPGLIACQLNIPDDASAVGYAPSIPSVGDTLTHSIEELISSSALSTRLVHLHALRGYFVHPDKPGLPRPQSLSEVLSLYEPHVTALASLNKVFEASETSAASFAQEFEPLLVVADFKRTFDREAFLAAPHPVTELVDALQNYQKWVVAIERVPVGHRLVAVQAHSKDLKGNLLPVAQGAIETLQEAALGQLRTLCSDTATALRGHQKALTQKEGARLDLPEYVNYVKYVATVAGERRRLAEDIARADGILEVLENSGVSVDVTDRSRVQTIHEEQEETTRAHRAAREYIAKEKASQLGGLDKRHDQVVQQVSDLKLDATSGLVVSPDADATTALQRVNDIRDQLATLRTRSDTYNGYASLLKVEEKAEPKEGEEGEGEGEREGEAEEKKDVAAPEKDEEEEKEAVSTDYDSSSLDETIALVDLKRDIWSAVAEWNDKYEEITNMDWRAQDVEEVVTFIQTAYKNAVRFSRRLEGDEVSLQLMRTIDTLRLKISLLQDLGNPALQNRHWSKVFSILDSPSLSPKVSFSLDSLLQAGAQAHRQAIGEISAVASGEFSLELALKQITAAWQDMAFQCKAHMRGGKAKPDPSVVLPLEDQYHILASVEDITQLLEDNQVTLQTMLASRFIVGIRKTVEVWEKRLGLLSELLDEWLQCQLSWLYLEVIFAPEDIKRQLPVESTQFEEVNAKWRDFMQSVAATPSVLSVLETPDILATFVDHNKRLDGIQKKLEQYLETKRMAFPRFFFLSNDELLEILSQTTEPRAVQPHLRKIFENIATLEFEDHKEPQPSADEAAEPVIKTVTEITHMASTEGESVKFLRKIKASGPVENWLMSVEDAMKETIKWYSGETLRAMHKEEREHWLFAWPAQCVLACDQIDFCTGVEDALTDAAPGQTDASLGIYYDGVLSNITGLVELVRGDLTKLQRRAIGTLIVVTVHGRDVVHGMLSPKHENYCTSVNDFGWLKQLRYYYDTKSQDVMLKQTSTSFAAGYEFYGVTARLVITPLTDRCYMTLTTAIHLHLGGSPQGPAGTGKTETVKDLAKAMMIQCVVFNCSDGLDYKMMGRFFSGLAQTGAWACFDEFNRIDIEVLSVIAQQILSIQRAIMVEAKTFVFEGSEIKLNPQCGFFITMNPGYAGRTELPDNLKALFRPIAMMVPDYSLIAEIILFSEGFSTAKGLARKMTRLYKLSSEQLSQQDHYDFGMRAIKAVLVMAGACKRQYTDLSEDVVLIRAMRDSNVPKYLSEDVPLFMGIVQDLFPGVDIPEVDFGILQEMIETVMAEQHLQTVPSFITKILQFFDTHVVRHGLMLVGESGTGKTVVRDVLFETLNRLAKDPELCKESNQYRETIQTVLNPKAITMGELYGEFNLTSHEWTDGLVANIARKLTPGANQGLKQWIVFDGPVDALWIENMNTVLDDNKMLCLANGERIRLPPMVNAIFEVRDLAVASPATVSRCGMVFMEDEHIGWAAPVRKWLAEKRRLLMHLSCVEDLQLDLTHFEQEAEVATSKHRSIALSKERTDTEAIDAEVAVLPDVQNLKTLDEHLGSVADLAIARLYAQLEGVVPALIKYCRNNAQEYMASLDAQLVQGVLDLMEAQIAKRISVMDDRLRAQQKRAKEKKAAEAPEEDEGESEKDNRLDLSSHPMVLTPVLKRTLDMRLLFSLTWSMGGNLVGDCRPGFDDKLNSILRDKELHAAHPTADIPALQALVPRGMADGKPMTVFDYYVDEVSRSFAPWSQAVPKFTYDPAVPSYECIVPTVDSVRQTALVALLAQAGKNVLLCGPTGTAKSVVLSSWLRTGECEEEFNTASLGFSAQTQPEQTEGLLQEKLERKRKNLFGPPAGKRQIFFVDDINMPAQEIYGAQPPVELVRQIIDQEGCYDRKKLFFKHFANCQFMAACAPAGGGRNAMTMRLVRRFHLLAAPELSEASLRTIFTSILGGFLDTPFGPAKLSFSEALLDLSSPLVDATINLYNTMKDTMRPTPVKSHYTFNLRDLAGSVLGLLTASPLTVSSKSDLTRLWVHESARVFRDRLIDDADRKRFDNIVVDQLTDTVEIGKWTEMAVHPEPVSVLIGEGGVDGMMIGRWAPTKAETKRLVNMTDDTPPQERLSVLEYRPVGDADEYTPLLQEQQEDYNLSNSGAEMNLVFFRDAVKHLSRVHRIITRPRGNALCVGMGGSGRQSLARLAAHLAGFSVIQPEISKVYGFNEFKEDIKRVLLRSGAENQATVFLMSDNQIVEESFLELVNNLLNSGEVPNLWAVDEFENIIETCRPQVKALGKHETRDAIYQHFVNQCRANLHIVLALSPVGSAFRRRCRQFPALISCMTIDWFSPWPGQALKSVANGLLANVDLGPEGPRMRDAVASVMVTIHESVMNASEQFFQQLRRRVYTTPTSYLELVRQYSEMLAKTRDELQQRHDTFANGLEKLTSTRAQVADMQVELNDLQPVLEQSAVQTDQLMVRLKVDSKEANIVRVTVAKEEKDVAQLTLRAKAIQEDAQRDLDEAMPAYEAAVVALRSLNKGDITEIRSFKTPPAMVMTVMEAVCILLGEKPTWDEAKKLMGNTQFLPNLEKYDKDHIPAKTLRKLRKYIQDPEFVPKKVERVSVAAMSLCMWVIAINTYAKVAATVEPKKLRLKEAQEELQLQQSELAKKQGELASVEQRLAELQGQFDESTARKAELEQRIADTKVRLVRAKKLVDGLAEEYDRWSDEKARYAAEIGVVVGNVLVCSGYIAYLGPFTIEYRKDLVDKWIKACVRAGIPVTDAEGFGLEAIAGDPVQTRHWMQCGLPSDSLSIDNAIICTQSRRWPLMIDPQGQAVQWVQKMEKERGLQCVKPTNPNFLRVLENCVRIGTPVLLENVGETLDPALNPILAKEIYRSQGRLLIRLGDQEIDYNPDFQLYITTRLANPTYSPEVSIKAAIINMAVSTVGLEEQLLALVVNSERPDLEETRDKLVVELDENRRELKSIQDNILEMLASSTGNILDNEDLINALNNSKVTQISIDERVSVAEKTAAEINTARERYRPSAVRGQVLYFTLASLAGIDPMYVYSLGFFRQLFQRCLTLAPASDDFDERIANIISYTTMSTFEQVSRGLFEKHKSMFAFLMASAVERQSGIVLMNSWVAFLRGPSEKMVHAAAEDASKPEWATNAHWGGVQFLQTLPAFGLDFAATVGASEGWKTWITHDSPETEPLPDDWDERLGAFDRLLLVRCVRSERVLFSIPLYVGASLGAEYLTPPEFSLEKAFQDTTTTTPIIFILSPGADPLTYLFALAKERGFTDKLRTVSLGQGQGEVAERMLKRAWAQGEWVCLQNCHLCVSWMTSLDRIVEEMPSKTDIHPDFRLWLTSMPSDKFPSGVLATGVKLTNEAPRGLRANLLLSYQQVDGKEHEEAVPHTRRGAWKRLLFGLTFFHAVLQERRRFGPIGFNIPYDFSITDLQVSMKMLKQYLNSPGEGVPYQALRYLTGEIAYGGRVTDDWDQRCVVSVLDKFYTEDILSEGYAFDTTGLYKPPAGTASLPDVLQYVQSLPLAESPLVYGLHPNADITYQALESAAILDTIVQIQPRVGGGEEGLTPQQMVMRKCRDIMSQLPPNLDVSDNPHPDSFVVLKQTGTPSPFSTVLRQECDRYNKLLNLIRESLKEVQSGINGLTVMSDSLEKVFDAALLDRVPEAWKSICYPCLKPLSSFVRDLVKRVAFHKSWIVDGPPAEYWIGAFYFPHGFMTGILQQHSRMTSLPIDSLVFSTHVLPFGATPERPPCGVNLSGLYAEGCRWDQEKGSLIDPEPGVLMEELPSIWLEPIPIQGEFYHPDNTYEIPMYTTTKRHGVLSTTGSSTNFVTPLHFPCTQPEAHWIQRGAAAFIQSPN